MKQFVTEVNLNASWRQPLAQSKLNQTRLLRAVSIWILSFSKNGDSTISLDNLF